MGFMVCEKCGNLAYYNSYFGTVVCPQCGWRAKKTPPKRYLVEGDRIDPRSEKRTAENVKERKRVLEVL